MKYLSILVKTARLAFLSAGIAILSRGAFAACPCGAEDLSWVDSAVARFGTNYTHLAENAANGYTREAPYPKTFRDGKVVFCKDWDWCSGFFQGCLWYLYEATGDAKWRALAEKYTEEQAHIRTSNLHHDLGFMFLPSAGHAYRLTGEKKYAGYLYDAARTLCTRWRPRCGAIQVWGNWNGKWADSCSVIVDCMLNLELLEWAGKNPCEGWDGQPRDWLDGGVFLDMAQMHADTTIKYLLRPDGSSYHIALLDFKSGELIERRDGQGVGRWSRGQGWVVYGFPMMYAFTREQRYLDAAVKAADYALNEKNVPADRIPYWDYCAPDIPNEERDSSAAAVLGCGFLKLSKLCPDKKKAARYRAEAVAIAKSLSSDAYFAGPSEIGGFVLKHAVGSKPHKADIDVPLNYGDYYYLELLTELKRQSGKK